MNVIPNRDHSALQTDLKSRVEFIFYYVTMYIWNDLYSQCGPKNGLEWFVTMDVQLNVSKMLVKVKRIANFQTIHIILIQRFILITSMPCVGGLGDYFLSKVQKL